MAMGKEGKSALVSALDGAGESFRWCHADTSYPAFFAPFGDVANGERGPEVPYRSPRGYNTAKAVLCHLRRRYCGYRPFL